MKKLGDFAEWKAASKKLVELQLELTEVEQAHAAGLANLASEPTRADKLTAKALLLLGGGAAERPTLAEREAEVETMSERRRVLLRATEIQRAELQRVEAVASREICKELRPRYVALVKSLAGAVDALAKAAEQERLFREELRGNGVQFASYLPPVALKGGWSRPGDDYSPANMFHREAKASGYL